MKAVVKFWFRNLGEDYSQFHEVELREDQNGQLIPDYPSRPEGIIKDKWELIEITRKSSQYIPDSD